jgi:hypothetical protein
LGVELLLHLFLFLYDIFVGNFPGTFMSAINVFSLKTGRETIDELLFFEVKISKVKTEINHKRIAGENVQVMKNGDLNIHYEEIAMEADVLNICVLRLESGKSFLHVFGILSGNKIKMERSLASMSRAETDTMFQKIKYILERDQKKLEKYASSSFMKNVKEYLSTFLYSI